MVKSAISRYLIGVRGLFECIFGPAVGLVVASVVGRADGHVVTVAGDVVEHRAFTFVHGEVEYEVGVGILNLFLHELGNLGGRACGAPQTYLCNLDVVAEVLRAGTAHCQAGDFKLLIGTSVVAVNLDAVDVEDNLPVAPSNVWAK